MDKVKIIDLIIPNLGEAQETEVIEVSVKVGDKIKVNDPLIVLESEKAAMEVPSDYLGEIKSITIKEGDNVSEGNVFGSIEILEESTEKIHEEIEEITESKKNIDKNISPVSSIDFSGINAGPAVRKIARELEIDLKKISGSGKNAMITKEDLKNYIKSLSSGGHESYHDINELKDFGDYDVHKQTKIRALGAKNLHKSWVSIPHVTHFEEVDITELENMRKKLNKDSAIKITPLSFLIRVLARSLKEFKIFNSSIVADGEIMIKKYINIGVAIDTSDGLIVPNIKNADSLNEVEIATQVIDLANKAKNKKLLQKHLQGATFTISSLGPLGGIGFTPIINPPEVAILGVSKSKTIIQILNEKVVERIILPISLSYDHRVINGADAGRFMNYIKEQLETYSI